MDNLLFGQQNLHNIKYFGENYTTIPIKKFPHYKFLEGNINEYERYLKIAWDGKERPINKKINEFINLKKSIENKNILIPILISKRYDKEKVIIHGNHRASIAEYFGIDIECKYVNFFNFFDISKLRYGLNNSKRPYQSIFYHNNLLIEGRRKDILDRFNYIDIRDIKDKIVIDIGCNLGANCILMNRYTEKTIGIDINQQLLNQSIKLALYFNESIDYRLCDFSKIEEKVDTCFLFSVDKHINNDKKIAKFIDNKVKNIVYFETHENSIFPKKIRNCFSHYKLLRIYQGRKLYRCEK